ncbi:PREDICTED: uncharacterized protein LOC101313258 [Fragaria vesca subsp. vesca]
MNIYDPRNWDNLNAESRDLLVENGPVRDLLMEESPQHKSSVGFRSEFYTRIIANGEKVDRDWPVYSKEFVNEGNWERISALIGESLQKSEFAKEGCGDWGNVGVLIREHERSMAHMFNMTTWKGLRLRLKKDESDERIDNAVFKLEKEHWSSVLLRIIAVVKFLAKNNMTFFETTESMDEEDCGMDEEDCGNLTSFIEMIAEWDYVMQAHIRRIKINEIRHHYLGRNIQELMTALASEIKSAIVRKIKEAKYFSVIVDCAFDAGGEKQTFLILRDVDVSTSPIKVDEYFLEFLNLSNTSEHGPFEQLQNVLKALDLDIDDIRGQGYGIGSLVKGRAEGIQEKLSGINPRALYTPWGCCSLNVTLCDMVDPSSRLFWFFGSIQCIYSVFAHCTKCWQILEDNVKGFALEPSSTKRWESHIECVKAIRFHASDVREALLEVADTEIDLGVVSQANSLAEYDLEYGFLLGMIIWFDILSAVDVVSKYLQSKDMCIDSAIAEMKRLIQFFERYREVGFTEALKVAKDIATEMEIDCVFDEARERRRRKCFGKNVDQSSPESLEESFRVQYFLYTVDQVTGLLKRTLAQYQAYEDIFGFLFCSEKLNSFEEKHLKTSCCQLEMFLNHEKFCDVDGNSLFEELQWLRKKLPEENMTAIEILNFINRLDCLPNAYIAYRIMLTIPVLFTSTGGFSKLEILNSYLQSPMSQEVLDGLALISTEKGFLEKLDYDSLIDDCATKNARRTILSDTCCSD